MELLKSISFCCILMTTIGGIAQSKDHKAINEAIAVFSKAGDKNDYNKLNDCLDDNYRIVMNRLFGSKEVSIMPKSVYLEKIKSKEFGGDKRKLAIEDLVTNGSTAMAKITFNGEKMKTVSLITLVKNEKGEWKLVSDVPIVI